MRSIRPADGLAPKELRRVIGRRAARDIPRGTPLSWELVRHVTRRVLVRCDGTRETGLGHVSRCLALAEALAEREIASIFCGAFDAPARRLLGEAGIPIEPARCAEEVSRLASERACTGDRCGQL